MPDAFIDATGLAELVRRNEITPGELVEETLDRIGKVDPQLNSVVVTLAGKARAEAADAPDGPFRGVPYLLKEVMPSKGDIYAAGIKGVIAAGLRADHDTYLVQAMRAAGFVLTGRSNTSEMALVATTESAGWGTCRNPWDTSRSTGGSSGGAAAAVAAGLVPVAHGSDGGGSVREPAAKCGIVGIKPTRGRISQGPQVIDSDNVSGMAHEGWMTRSVRDCAALLDVTGGHRPGDAFGAWSPPGPFAGEVGADPGRLRIGVLTEDPTGQTAVDPECAAAARAAADVLAGLGHDVRDGYPEVLRQGSWPMEFMPCVGVVVLREIERFGRLVGRPLTEDDMEPQTWAYTEVGRTVTGVQYAAGVDALRERGREIERWWEDDGWDLLLTPTLTGQTPLLGLFNPTKEDPFSSLGMEASTFTVPFNVSGQPAISLPLHWAADGMPVGVQFGAAHGREDVLIRVASQLEAAMPWAGRIPAVHA
ncbi:amidase [Actinomadura welshii]|uniref:amidase n=1 Tax=Actinomadura welshii TaxID=3103817 RepID=UPI0003ACF5CC|nr:amidase [Actinomadura madurae]